LPNEVVLEVSALFSSPTSSISKVIFARFGTGDLGVANFFVRESSGDFFIAQGKVLGILIAVKQADPIGRFGVGLLVLVGMVTRIRLLEGLIQRICHSRLD